MKARKPKGSALRRADGVATALDAVAALADGQHAGVALRLAEHAIDRIEQAVESIDDSDGHCGTLLVQAREIHLAACRVARPDPVALARNLFDRDANLAGYEEAAGLVKRMAGLRDVYVAGLKDRHKRKRDFMKLL